MQQFFTIVGVMLSPCSYRMALGLRGRRSRFEAAGRPPFRVYHEMAAVGYQRTSEQPKVLLRDKKDINGNV